MRTVALPPSGLALHGLFEVGRVDITDDGQGIASELAARLVIRGINARVIGEIPDDAAAIIYLGGLNGNPSSTGGLSVLKHAFQAARTVAVQRFQKPAMFVTVQETGGDFGLSGTTWSSAFVGGLAGLTKTAALEWPEAAVKAIDLDRGSRTAPQLAQALEQELLFGGAGREIGLLADGTRVGLECVANGLSAKSAIRRIGPESIWVVSGGGRGVTAACVLALGRSTQAHFVLLGRTEWVDEPTCCAGLSDESALRSVLSREAMAGGQRVSPLAIARQARDILAVREIRHTLTELSTAGALARYCNVDVRDATALDIVLNEVRNEWGPITGLIHGAGVLADRLIVDKTDEQFEHVIRTKIDGACALLTATANDPLTHIVMFSSVAARYGNSGQCDYAMANEVLNKLAVAEFERRSRQCLIKAINWGPWDGGMVTPELKSYFAKHNVPLIPLEAGAQLFVDELCCGAPDHIEVVIGAAPRTNGLTASPRSDRIYLHVVLDARAWPFLADHSIRGVPVVPMVFVLELFVRAATTMFPDLALVTCRHLRALRGIELRRFHSEAGQRFSISCESSLDDEKHEVTCFMTDENGVNHYSATLEMGVRVPGPPHTYKELSSEASSSWPCNPREAYDGMLFHGPAFQVLRSLERISNQQSIATLTDTAAMKWRGEPWLMDPATLDGGLQIASLRNEVDTGRKSLPIHIGLFTFYQANSCAAPFRLIATKKRRSEHGVKYQLRWLSASGETVAEADDVETFFRP